MALQRQIFLQIDSGRLMPQAVGIYYMVGGRKSLAKVVFIFMVSYTRKGIK